MPPLQLHGPTADVESNAPSATWTVIGEFAWCSRIWPPARRATRTTRIPRRFMSPRDPPCGTTRLTGATQVRCRVQCGLWARRDATPDGRRGQPRAHRRLAVPFLKLLKGDSGPGSTSGRRSRFPPSTGRTNFSVAPRILTVGDIPRRPAARLDEAAHVACLEAAERRAPRSAVRADEAEHYSPPRAGGRAVVTRPPAMKRKKDP